VKRIDSNIAICTNITSNPTKTGASIYELAAITGHSLEIQEMKIDSEIVV
jgi:hypothetical protein